MIKAPKAPPEGPSGSHQRRALSQITGPVSRRGDPVVSARLAEAWERASGAEVDSLTHPFHAYPARMHPWIARHLLADARGCTVLDPFVGSGTVAIEGLRVGARVVGVDVNPVSLRIAWARTRLWGAEDIDAFEARARRLSEEAFRRARERRSVALSDVARAEADWYAPHVLMELQVLADAVEAEPDADVAELLRMVLSSLLVKVSFQASESDPRRIERQIGRGTASRLFGDKATLLARGLRELAAEAPPGTPPVALHLGDARDLRDVADGAVDLIVTSPPYPGVYNYPAHQARRYPWLGEVEAEAARHEIGARRRGAAYSPEAEAERALAEWEADQAAFLGEMGRVLRPGGRAFLVIGDSALGPVAWRADVSMTLAAPRARLRVEASASQARPATHPGIVRAFGDQPRYEHLLALVKIGR